jgi:hypothetical protein
MITLQLTPQEAKTLYFVLNRIGGSLMGTCGRIELLRTKLLHSYTLWGDTYVNLDLKHGFSDAIHFADPAEPDIIKTVKFVYDKGFDGIKWRKVEVTGEDDEYITGFENGMFKKFLKSKILGGEIITI